MKAYIVEIRESDGNDCTVYDCIVEAESHEDAFNKVYDHFSARAAAEGWESDGGEGWYFPCDCDDYICDPDYECEGHGGIVIGEPEEFASYADAMCSHTKESYYHSLYTV